MKRTPPPGNGFEWESFDQLVCWAAWEIAQALLGGQKLHDAMFSVCVVVRAAKFKEHK